MKRQIQVGDFVQYIKRTPKEYFGQRGLVFRLVRDDTQVNLQVVWFPEKEIPKYEISGASTRKVNGDVRKVTKPPKKILKRVEEALLSVVKQERNYYDGKFTNLDYIEVLAKVRKLV